MKKFFQIKSIFALLMMFFCCYSLSIEAENPGKKKKKEESQTEYKGDVGNTITLVTSGTGETKEEATKNALRSALEQTYGAFVSSNSKVVNDELISDEIVSISTGNIAKYEILSVIDSKPIQVTTKAVVSISNLQSYAQNKGMSAELAGNTFAMNMKMEELNIQNEKKALANFVEQLRRSSSQVFDYKIDVGSPQKNAPKSEYEAKMWRVEGRTPNVTIPITLKIIANKNTLAFYDMLHGTLSSLCTGKQIKDNGYNDSGLCFPQTGSMSNNCVVYSLRSGNHNHSDIGVGIIRALENAVFCCKIVDNIGNVSGFRLTEEYDRNNDSESCYRTFIGSFWSIPTNKLKTTRGAASGNNNFAYFDNQRHYVDSWLGAKKPALDETIYEVKLIMEYTIDEISKISKIEVRPK